MDDNIIESHVFTCMGSIALNNYIPRLVAELPTCNEWLTYSITSQVEDSPQFSEYAAASGLFYTQVQSSLVFVTNSAKGFYLFHHVGPWQEPSLPQECSSKEPHQNVLSCTATCENFLVAEISSHKSAGICLLRIVANYLHSLLEAH